MADEPIVPQINTVNPTSADVTAGGGTPNIDATQVPLSSSPAAAAPNTGAQNTPMPRPANPADVNNNAAGNPNANVPQTPAQQHASIFHKVFSMLNGGGNRPQYEPSTLSDGSANPRAGQPMTNPDGSVKMGQASTKQLGMGILSGAIASMMAGMSTPPTYQKFGHASVPNYAGSFAAGAQAGQKFSQQGTRTEAQQQADLNTTRQYTTLKNNLDMHVLMQGVHRGDTQDFQSAVDSFKETLDNAQDEQDAGNLVDKDGKPIQLIRDGEVTNEQGLDMLKKGEISSVKSQMIPSRVIQAPNDPSDPSKGMHPVMMYKILTDAGTGLGTVPLTDAMKKELGSKWDNAPVDTTKVPISLLLQNAHTRATSAQAGGTVSDWTRELQAVDPDNQKLKDFSYSAWSASNPGDAKALNQVLTAHKGQHADIGLNQILTNKDFSGDAKVMSAMNKLQTAMGVTAESLEKMGEDRDARKAADKEKALEAIKPLTKDEAESNLSKPDITPVERTRAEKFLQIYNQQEADKKRTSDAIEQSVKQGDPDTAGKLLYDGTLTLSELKGRSVTPKFIADATNAGLAMARQNGEPDWTPQRAEAQFHAAESNQNVQFFGSANSLLDPTGTLSQLKSQHTQLGNTPFPLLNSVKDYLEYQASDPALAGFMQTAIGVADDYAKVMGGGVGSDVSRLQVLKSFANAHSPEQMDAALSAARNAVKSQVAARIGRNRVMQQMYGQNVPQASNVAPKPPAGATSTLHDTNNKVVGWRVNGNLIGLDGKPYRAPQQ